MSLSYGNLCVVNKDGSFGSSVGIKNAMTFGSSYPAKIRIKSKSISAEHARVDVDENGECFLVPLTAKHEPKINSVKIKARSVLSNNDRISIGGRVFVFSTTATVNEHRVYNRPIKEDVILNTITAKKSEKKGQFGQLSLMQTNGDIATVVKIRDELIIGREYPSTFRIKSPFVSKQHLKIVINADSQCVLTHLSKTNPPIINGVEVISAILKNGDKICIGDFILTYSSTDSSSDSLSIDDASTESENVSLKNKNKSEMPKKKIRPLGNKENSRNVSNLHYNITNKKQAAEDKDSVSENSTKPEILSPSSIPFINSTILPQDATEMSSVSQSVDRACEQSPGNSTDTTAVAGAKVITEARCCHVNMTDSDDNYHPIAEAQYDSGATTILTTTSTACRSIDYIQPSAQSLQAMRSDTQSLLPSGRPSMETMMAQWEFMRDQFLGSSDEALEWLMLSKTGGVEAYKHATRKTQLAEDQYFKSLFEIDLLEAKRKLISQDLAPVLKGLSNVRNVESNLKRLQKLYTSHLQGICSQQLSTQIDHFLANSEQLNLLELTVKAYEEEMKILSERLHRSQTASEECLGEMEKWSEREKNTTAYREALLAADVLWMKTQQTANERALADMRELIPSNISQLSVSDLTNILRDKGGFYSHGLCAELKKNKLLQLVVMHTDDIAKLNFLMGDSKQYFLDMDLDVVEMRAIRTCLPDVFELDKDGRKAEWRERFIAQLKQLVARENGDFVKGGWDSDAGKRVQVRLPALRAVEQRRPVYFYETPQQLQNQLARYEKQETLLAAKKQLLNEIELEHVDFKMEYNTILSESRNPVYQQHYGTRALAQAKENAKEDLAKSEKKKKTVMADISRIEASIKSASMTKDDVLQYITDHKQFVPDWETSKDIPVPIKGVFDRHPVIHRAAKASAVFVTAEEEAASRKSELLLLQKRPSNVTTPSSLVSIVGDEDSNLVMNAESTESDKTQRTIKNNSKPTITNIRPVKSKNLQKIIDASKNEPEGGRANLDNAAPTTTEHLRAPPLSFLDQLKNMKKKKL